MSANTQAVCWFPQGTAGGTPQFCQCCFFVSTLFNHTKIFLKLPSAFQALDEDGCPNTHQSSLQSLAIEKTVCVKMTGAPSRPQISTLPAFFPNSCSRLCPLLQLLTTAVLVRQLEAAMKWLVFREATGVRPKSGSNPEQMPQQIRLDKLNINSACNNLTRLSRNIFIQYISFLWDELWLRWKQGRRNL